MNTNMTLEKRILSVLLTVIMVFSMVPLSVFAAEGNDYVAEVTVGNTTTPYDDIVQAFNAAKYASGSVTVKLLDDIDRFATGFSKTDGVQFQSGDVTLDLNGHYIDRYNNAAGTIANNRAVFYVTGSAKMTVMDSVGGGVIIQWLSDPALIVDSSASLTVLSGTITNNGAGSGIRVDGGTLTVGGGTISASYDAGICVGGGTVTVTGTPEIYGGKTSALLITGESTVTLSGGTYTTNETNKRSILTMVGKVTDLLAEGFRFTDSNGMDIAITEDGQGTDSDNVTVSDFGIKYIDADGTEQKCTSFTEITDASNGLLNGWYAVTGTVNIGGAIGVAGDNTLNLILCDGATLNLKNPLYMLSGSKLNIYGQSGGTGTLIVKAGNGQAAIGIMSATSVRTVTVNIYGGTVTAQASNGAQPIGINPSIMQATVNVTIAKGLKCVKTDDLNTAYAYDNTDGTSITITKCTEHKWLYTDITDDTHDQTCELCGTTETGAKHTTARYRYVRREATIHHLICACGEEYGTEYHTYTYAPNSDGLTHTATCICQYAVDDIEHTYKGEDKKCICDAVHSATYDGKKYASLQSAVDAAAPVGGTVTLARQLNENVVVTDGTVTIDLSGNRWSADISYSEKGYVPLTVNGGNVTLKNGNLFQGSSTSTSEAGIVINGGSVTVEEDARVMGGSYDRGVIYPSITLNGGTLILKEGAALLTGLQVPEGKVLADYLTEGTAFVKCSYDNNSNTVTVSDPQEFVPDVYTANKLTERMVIVSHTHDFGSGTACPCGLTCMHNGGNDREASYFEKAICSVCHSEYGDYVKDTTALTGEIKFKERTWWQTVLNKISFGLFYKEYITVEITATDDSYGQLGYDETKHAVKIEYYISDGVLNEEAVINSSEFIEYTRPFALVDEQQYVVYVRLTDHAGNVAYAGSAGFEIDKTAPLIEGMGNGGVYSFCGEKTITVTDKNIDKITMDGTEITLDENGQYTLPVDSEKHKIIVADKAENETTVWITVYPSHNFDKTTDTCLNCGTLAAAKVENGDISDRFATGDELFEALEDAKYNGATVTLLTDVTVTGNMPVKNDLTIDLNGKKLQGAENKYIMVISGTVRIYSSSGEGSVTADFSTNSAEASLTMDNGIGEAGRVMFRGGHLAICSGRYDLLNIVYEEGDVAERVNLLGGSYDSIYLASAGSATAEQLLSKGYRYNNRSYSTVQGKKQLSKVSVIPCDHADLDDFVCVGCSMEIFLSVEANGTTTLFGTFADAVRYAEQNEGSTVKLLRDIKLDEAMAGSLLVGGYKVELTTGRYTIDLNGKSLDINDNEFVMYGDGDLTIGDSAGGGKVMSNGIFGSVCTGSSGENNAKLTVTGGEFTVNLTSFSRNALVLKGGSFVSVISDRLTYHSPFIYLADGYTFAFSAPSSGNDYANEGNAKTEADGSKKIENVSVVPAPLYIPGSTQPQDKTFYLTSPDEKKLMSVWLSCRDLNTDKKITITLEKTDGTAIMSKERSTSGILTEAFDLKDLAESSDQYRVKIEFNGYVLYSDTFTITVAECEHPGYDENNKCTQCGCELAAAIVKNGKTTGYVNFEDALAAAQTDENKGCVLWLLTDVSGRVTVSGGDFKFSINGYSIGGLGVTKTAKLNIFSGTINGTVAVAKTANLIASVTNFMDAVNDLGNMSSFINCVFVKSLSAKGSNTNLNNCTINGALNVSGNKVTLTASTVYGKTTVNNGGLLRFMGNGGKYGEMLVKYGGGLEVYSNNTVSGTITAQSGSKLTLSGGVYTEIAAESGAKLTISGGEFKNITVNGQHLIDCLAEGKAFEDMNNGFIIDGRVGIAGDVKVVDHTHTCIWKTSTHEKLCGCGYVEATDTEAPVISGIDPDNNHYGSLEFSVTDENDFTVWMDGEEITLVNGKYTMEPDNETHLITATDVAGNTVSFRFGIFKTYHVTLPTGAGYTIFHSDGLTVRHGNSFSFIVQFNKGYSKTEDFKVLVNGNKLDELWSDTDSASFAVIDVSEDLVITVEGVADITAPEVEVSIRGNSFKEFLNRITFGLFFKQTQMVEVKANDFGSGIDKVEYLLSETAFADKDAITGAWTELDLNDAFKAYFNIEPSQKTFIYVRVTDNSGNIAVVNTDGLVLYTDAEAITGAMTIRRLDGADASFAVRLNGNTVNSVRNGDAMLVYDRDYTVSENGVITLKADYLSTLAAGEYTIRVAYNPLGESFDRGDEPAMTTVKLTVEKRLPKIVLADWTIKSYDGDPIDPAKTGPMTETNGAMTWEYKPVGADDSEYTATAPKNAGEYTVRLTTAETDNYEAGEATALFVIVQKEVTIKGVTVSDKTYDGTSDATIASDGTVDGTIADDEVTVVRGKAAFADKNVGTDKNVTFAGFSLAGDDAGNYKLVAQPADTTADITVKEITINGAAVESSKVYDGTTDAEITDAGAPTENFDGENLTIVAGSAAYDNKNVGTGKTVSFTGFALAGDAAANYKLVAQPVSVTADITVKEITVNGAAVEASRIYDGTTDAKITSAGTPSVNYDGDNLTVVAGKAAYDNKNVGVGKTVTFTGFALKGSAAGNYKLTAQPDAVTADITVKEIKIVDTAVEASKVYDGSTDAKITENGTFDGLIDGDKVDIVTGKAAYDDKNVGNGKTVTFYDFALSGDDAANYVLAAQPASTTASISAKELTIKDLKVKDKQYDGKNTAAIDGTPTLVGVVDGDVLTLVNGVPTFDSVKIGKNIAISFTAFTLSGDRVTVGNYTLKQPSGITANIVEYVADGSEYSVNSNDWINKDFVITAKEGYKLSLTDTANGEWSDTLSASDETGKGKLTFYVKNTETGVISAAVTESYKIDKTAPTGEVKLNERTAFQEFISKITFGLFFKDDVNVKLTAKDEASGVKSVLYFKSDKILTDDEVRAITDWTDNSDFDIKAKDMDKFIIYVRIEDNAGNVTYIGSDGATFDTTAPKMVGAENGKTYYVTKKVAIDDENFESVTVNGEPVEDVFTLDGDKDATYVIRAVDKAGNVTEYTVTMKPISSITDAISAITVDNVKSSDAETVSAVERQILGLSEAFDDGESTEAEKNKLTEAAAKCKDLLDRLAAAKDAAGSSEITDVKDITKDNVKREDKDALEKAEKALEKALSDFDSNYTEEERKDLEKQLETIKAALAALENPAKTGDSNSLVLWIALLFVSGGVMTGITVVSKKKKHSVR